MSSLRTFLLISASCAACASATHSQQNQQGTTPDAPAGRPPSIDAPVATPQPDSSTSQPLPDASQSTGGCGFSGVLATWSFSGEPGSQTSTPVMSTATGVTAGDVARASGLTATSGSGSMNSSGWPTSSQLNTSYYYTLTITPPSGCSLSITSAAIDAKASSTGPTAAAVATSADNFAQTASVSTSTPSTPSLSVSGQTGQVEVRIYGYSAGGASGTMRVQNTLTISGSLQ